MPVYAYVLIGVAALVLLLVAVAALRPGKFAITRSATMDAQPWSVFAQVNEFRKWEAWSPWAKLDPAMKQTYDGPPSGVGAVSAWEGKKVGAGRMTITESEPSKRIRLTLEFFKPMACSHLTEFTFVPEGGGTRMTWTMTGENGLMGKLFCLFMNLDKMVGPDFEKGLAGIKAIVEGDTSARAAA